MPYLGLVKNLEAWETIPAALGGIMVVTGEHHFQLPH